MIVHLKINQASIKNISKKWAERELIFKKAEKKEYQNPFRGTASE